MAEKWLEQEIGRGLMGLIALRLDGAPAADSVEQMLDVWLEAAGGRRWDQELDTPRIQAAFRTLFRTCERWPAPARMLRELPAREQQQAIAAPARTDEQIERGRQQLSSILGRLKHLTPPQSGNNENGDNATKEND